MRENYLRHILKLIFLLVFTSGIISASVVAKLDKSSVELGEMASYSLEISGENIQRPDIKTLCGSSIVSSSSQTNIRGVNGKFKKSYTLSYGFAPQKSCTIEPVEVEINGRVERSNSVAVKVGAVTRTDNHDFTLTLSSDKKELFVGETLELTLTLKQKLNSQAIDSQFVPPELKGFWVKNEPKPLKSQDGNYEITKLVYKLAPQREGKLTISKAQIKVATKANSDDDFGFFVQALNWKTYLSNELELSVKPLPSNVSLIGNFTIKATPNKTEMNAGEAVSVNVEVVGTGNLEDIKSFKPTIDEVNIFDEKIAIEGAKLTQNLTFVADKDFTVPAFVLKYFDTKTKSVKTISSGEIHIKVNGAKPKEELVIKKALDKENFIKSDIAVGHDNTTLFIAFFIGLILGILLMWVKLPKIFKREKKSFIDEPKQLLVKLIPYKDSDEVREIMDILENNIYSNEKQNIDKKRVKEILKRYKIE